MISGSKSPVAATRIALAGFGAWGLMHARAIAAIDGAEVVAILVRSEASRAAAAQAVPTARLVDSLEHLLAFDDVDVVNVLLPNHLHAQATVAALEAGRHVLLEKPLGLSLAQCDAVDEASRRTGRLVAVNHELRVSHQWELVHRRIAQGDVGEVRHQHLSLFRKAFRTGAGGWRYDRERVGSWVLEELVHFIDLVLWYGEHGGMPESVTAFGGSRDHPLSDHFSMVLEWPGGATAVLNQCLGGFEHHTVLEVAGSNGALRTWWSGTMDRTTTPSFDLRMRCGTGDIQTLPIPISGEVFELEEHLRQAYAGFAAGRSVMPPDAARRSVAVALAAERSWMQGCRISLAG
jgi:myo-inositol 2-dehydrogenase / D-chiro-inositol 1-dehydrogenase